MLFFVFPVHLFSASIDITVDSLDPSCQVVLNIEITLCRIKINYNIRGKKSKILLMGARAGRGRAGRRAGGSERGGRVVSLWVES